jgi:hypothetical protein
MPGLTAEAALLYAPSTYCKSSIETTPRGQSSVVPQMPFRDCFAQCRDEGKPWIRCFLQCA